MRPDDEDEQLRQVALRNAQSVLSARQRVEDELRRAKQALESKAHELEQSLTALRAILEAATDGLLVTQADQVAEYNSNFARMWRIPTSILETRDHQRILEYLSEHVEDPEGFRKRVQEIESSFVPETFDVLKLTDGRHFERYSTVQFLDQKPSGRVWSYRDVTDRETADREHAYLASIITSSSDAIVSKSLDGIITSWNAGAERIFGYTAEEAVGQSVTLIIPPEFRSEEEGILQRLRRGERVEHFETVRRHKDGHDLKVSLTISPIRNRAGRIIGASKIARDTSERELLLLREQAARNRAEEASRLKDEFLATVSHELRTPLNAILGWASILRSAMLDPAKVRHAAEVLERNARAQAQVIDDLLDVSRIISGKLRLDLGPIMPGKSIDAALDAVRPIAEAKGVRLDALIDPHAGPISADDGRLQQVVWNLLSNAIKFTPAGGRVELRLERIQSHLEIVVTDTGEGIAPDFLPYVFDRFRQADASSTRATTGLGLGLTIVRHLVELHGGRIVAESPGKGLGSVFTVRLPLRPVLTRDEPEPRVHPRAQVSEEFLAQVEVPDLTGIRVLVVDDEPDTRELLREVLERSGAEVQEAGTVQRALAKLKKWRPSVLVSDIGMAGEDGYVLIRRLREWEKESRTWIPAVALTAYARSEDRMKALSAGFQVHVSKPIEPSEFVFVVAGVVQRPTSLPQS